MVETVRSCVMCYGRFELAWPGYALQLCEWTMEEYVCVLKAVIQFLPTVGRSKP
jgi:hypothetical protein